MTTAHEQEQEERRAYPENHKLLQKAAEDRRASTYLAHAMVDADAVGGRYRVADVGRAAVTGSGPIPHPHLPAPSWAGQDNMPELPLGYAIDDQIPVGSLAEQQRAAEILREREAAARPQAADSSGTSEAPTATPSPADVKTDVPLLQSNSSSNGATVSATRAPASGLTESGAGARLSMRRI